MASPVLDVQGLTVNYPSPRGPVRAVRSVSFQIGHREILALVGETGSGKSTTALALLGLLERGGKVDSGRLFFEGRDLLGLDPYEWRRIRGSRMGFLFQDARSALNPVLTVGAHLVETLQAHQDLTRKQARERAAELLSSVGIPEPLFTMRRYPFELSGGMCQRVGVALGICNNPSFLVADEPTSALDPSIQDQVLALLLEMRRLSGMALLLISHDLALVAESADRVAVMYHGRLVECGKAAEMFHEPGHPYTRALIECVPDLTHQHADRPLRVIKGALPSPRLELPGCPFAPRCPVVEPACTLGPPPPVTLSENHWAACFKAGRGEDHHAPYP